MGPGDPSDLERTSRSILRAGLLVAGGGLLLLGAYAWSQQSFLQTLTTGVLSGMAALTVSMLVGFIFGLPRYSALIVATPDPAGGANPHTGGAVRSAVNQFTPGSSLEQISDWLTKLLLGAGLVQLGAIGRWAGRLVDQLSLALAGTDATAGTPAGHVVAGSLLLVYGGLGFLFGYIPTTLWYRRRLNDFLSTALVAAHTEG